MRPRLARSTGVLSCLAVAAAAGACAKLARLERTADDGSNDVPAVEVDSSTDDGRARPPARPGDGDVFVPTPGVIPCGETTCAPPSRCCIEPGDEDVECRGQRDNCEGLEVNCDEAADCPGNDFCCLMPDPGVPSVWSFFCDPVCGWIRVCKSDAECMGRKCQPITCRGVRVGTCGGDRPPTCD